MRIVAFGDMINREEMEDEELDETVGFQMSELLFRLRCAPCPTYGRCEPTLAELRLIAALHSYQSARSDYISRHFHDVSLHPSWPA